MAAVYSLESPTPTSKPKMEKTDLSRITVCYTAYDGISVSFTHTIQAPALHLLQTGNERLE
jgi:hypothetical protein